jgi:hypothetical protein
MYLPTGKLYGEDFLRFLLYLLFSYYPPPVKLSSSTSTVMRSLGRLYISAAVFLLLKNRAFARLSQQITNGNSLLGDLSSPPLAEFLTDNPLPDGFPWGDATVFKTNYYTSSPNTGSDLLFRKVISTNQPKELHGNTTGQ